MFDFNLNKHFDSNEKLLLFFRPSRKAYLFQYFLLALVIILGIILFIFNYEVKFLFLNAVLKTFVRTALKIFGFAIFILAIVMAIRLEYRIWSRRYGITDERVMYSRGIFYEKFHSAKYNSITDLGLSQSFLDKIMNTGTLNLNTAGTDFYEIRYRKVSDPFKIKKMINDQIPSHKISSLTDQPVAQPFPELNKPLSQKRLVEKKKK